MEIVCGKYVLKSDNLNMWVEELYTAKNGEAASRVVTGYHRDCGHLLDSFAMKKLRGSEAQSMTQLLADIKAAESDMRELAKTLSESINRGETSD